MGRYRENRQRVTIVDWPPAGNIDGCAGGDFPCDARPAQRGSHRRRKEQSQRRQRLMTYTARYPNKTLERRLDTE